MLKEYIVINYENDDCCGEIAIAIQRFNQKKKVLESNQKYIDKVMRTLLKKKWKKFNQKKVVIDNE